uniref:Minor histocompatibility antigen H13 n=1 Tax=Megaselia scalaris TaxID=36166 RepID=T1GAY5_MEGSC
MVTVAKSFEAPIKLVFPQDLLSNGLNASNFAMLGLGDIVVPGIFIALLLRFDNSLKRKVKLYFYSTFAAYFLGLMATIFVMHVFKHAQPALLYLVPACLLTPILIALLKGDLKRLFAYEDNPEEKAKKEKAEKESNTNKDKESSSSKKKDSKKVK